MLLHLATAALQYLAIAAAFYLLMVAAAYGLCGLAALRYLAIAAAFYLLMVAAAYGLCGLIVAFRSAKVAETPQRKPPRNRVSFPNITTRRPVMLVSQTMIEKRIVHITPQSRQVLVDLETSELVINLKSDCAADIEITGQCRTNVLELCAPSPN